jgi:AraC family transcriptional regulator
MSTAMAQVVAHIARVGTPDFFVEPKREHGLSAARWRIGHHGLVRDPISHHVLTYHAHCGTTMTKVVGGVRSRRIPRPGSVTLVRATDRIEWTWDKPLDVIHIYIHPESLRRFAVEQLLCGAAPQLHDFFGIDDPWLAGYFQMLASECERLDIDASPAISQFLEESEPLLLRHLIRWHSSVACNAAHAAEPTPHFNALRPTVMRRIEEHVSTHLADVIHLATLAEVATMSVDHFLRSFRAACGTTPYQYILGLRLAKASTLLRETDAPIATIASLCGFHSASHFSVAFNDRFGIRPSQHRRRR